MIDFDKLRVSQSYASAINKWSMIAYFETVDILEGTTEQRRGQYVYCSFWAYGVVTGCWPKVYIRHHGHELGKTAATVKEKVNDTKAPAQAPQVASSGADQLPRSFIKPRWDGLISNLRAPDTTSAGSI
jgi:hypothetical protein